MFSDHKFDPKLETYLAILCHCNGKTDVKINGKN